MEIETVSCSRKKRPAFGDWPWGERQRTGSLYLSNRPADCWFRQNTEREKLHSWARVAIVTQETRAERQSSTEKGYAELASELSPQNNRRVNFSSLGLRNNATSATFVPRIVGAWRFVVHSVFILVAMNGQASGYLQIS